VFAEGEPVNTLPVASVVVPFVDQLYLYDAFELFAVNVTDCPSQIVLPLVVIETSGAGLTIALTNSLPFGFEQVPIYACTQNDVVAPTTGEYVVVLTASAVPPDELVNQSKLPFPLTLSVTCPAPQRVAPVVVVTVGLTAGRNNESDVADDAPQSEMTRKYVSDESTALVSGIPVPIVVHVPATPLGDDCHV